MNQSSLAEDSPVTIVAAHRVKPGKGKAFERVMSRLIQAAMAFEDHLGTNVLRPTDLAAPQYLVIFKFDCLSNLHRWEQSKVRHDWLLQIARLTQNSSPLQIVSGLETWFTLPLNA